MNREQGELLIASEEDIVTARTTIREIGTDLGFGLTDVTRIVTAASELARNVHLYADSGSMRWETISNDDAVTLEIVFEDDGPGIEDVDRALEVGHSTSDGMGKGLSGAQQLVDEFEITSASGEGTTVTIRKHRS